MYTCNLFLLDVLIQLSFREAGQGRAGQGRAGQGRAHWMTALKHFWPLWQALVIRELGLVYQFSLSMASTSLTHTMPVAPCE